MHLALRASADRRTDEALGYLKSATQRFPRNAKAHYLLGAEHAHIGMYDRAIGDISEAVRLDPTLLTAHFQLGLLHLTSGRAADAERAWRALDGLAPTEALYLFKTGLTHLIHDRLPECTAALEQGIERNVSTAALNEDMRRVLDDVRTRLNSGGSALPKSAESAAGHESAPGQLSGHALLSAYRQNSEDSTKGSN